jgi:hypothetical protein
MQALVYFFYKGKWVLPVAGFGVGYFTNWVALKLIFEPSRPWNLGIYTLQGLFLKRQHEAAGVIAANSMQFFLVQVHPATIACMNLRSAAHGMHVPLQRRSRLPAPACQLCGRRCPAERMQTLWLRCRRLCGRRSSPERTQHAGMRFSHRPPTPL